MILVKEQEQGSAGWLSARKATFNASECGALFECSPFTPKNQLELAHLKYGELTIYENQAMRDGTDAEPVIRERVEKLYNIVLEPLVACMDSDIRFRASFDGITLDEDIICEIKNSKHTYDKCKEGNIPKHYYLQMQHQFLISGAKECIFAVRNPEDDDVFTTIVKPDNKVMEEIHLKWLEFENTYKDKELPPLEREDIDWELPALKLREINSRIKELETEAKEYKETLVSLADGKPTKGFGVSVYPTKRKSTDYKKLIADNNIDTDAYIKESVSWSVRVS